MLKPTTVIFLLFVSVAQLIAQKINIPVSGNYVINYTEKEYGRFNAQNWSVCQDSTGLLYFGNSYNVLTFDGVHWGNIPVSGNGGYVVSMIAAGNGNIYWGSIGDLGVIETDARGKKTGKSFLNKIPELDRYFSQVWRTMTVNGKIVFFTQESIFIYSPEKDTFNIVYPRESFHLAFVVNDILYARDRAFGLMKFENGSFTEINGGEVFHNEGVFGMYPLGKGKILIVTQQIGLYIYDTRAEGKQITPLKSPYTGFLNRQQIIGGTMLADGKIALNTASNGVVIINDKGVVVQLINLSSGIADNDVKQVFQDKYHDLWLATNNGISRVNYSSNISFFLQDEQTGLYGSVNALAKTSATLFAGTTTGLFSYSASGDKAFNRVAGLQGNVTSLCAVDNEIFAGTSEALYLSDGYITRKLTDMDVRAIKYSVSKNLLYVIGANGFVIFSKKGGKWLKISDNGNIRADAIGAELISYDDVDNLWIGTVSQGVTLIKIRNTGEITAEIYEDVDGEPGSWTIPYFIENKVVVGTPTGLWRFVSRKEILAQMQDTAESSDIFPYFLPAEIPSLDSGVISAATHNDTAYWFVYNGIIGEYGRNKKLNQMPFLSIDAGKINTLLSAGNTLWVGANGGIVRYDFTENKNYFVKPDIAINRFDFTDDSVLFFAPAPGQTYNIDYERNSFTISFSSLYNENGKSPIYSYKLDGYDDDWSPWSNESYAVYKKIHEGNYVFMVKAKNVYNVESTPETVNIVLLSPWYRTWWAYLIYSVVFLLIIVGVVKVYTYRLKQKNIQLEAIIVERTKEIVKQKDEIEKQRDLIKEVHEEIQSSIAYAKRIQTAVLPKDELEHPFIKDFFVLFRPKDIVSGDFYWGKISGDYLVLTVADCTGHGVPGAFMSMLGISLLNEIVGKNKVTEAAAILNELRSGVIKSLKQRGESDDQKDGMDISLVSINLITGEIQWAGAHNPLFVVSEQKPQFAETTVYKEFENEATGTRLFELKPDKMPIAISQKMDDFTNHRFILSPGDRIYMFSDGYIDQFGGPKGKKFMIRNFRNLILEVSNKPLTQQKTELNARIDQWISYIDKDTQEPHHQIDDICVMGVKV